MQQNVFTMYHDQHGVEYQTNDFFIVYFLFCRLCIFVCDTIAKVFPHFCLCDTCARNEGAVVIETKCIKHQELFGINLVVSRI